MSKNIGKNISKNVSGKYSSGLRVRIVLMQQMRLKLLRKEQLKTQQKQLGI